MVKLRQFKIGNKKREMGEVKQRGDTKCGIECAAQPQYMGLNLFPDMLKASGIVINEGVLHGLSP